MAGAGEACMPPSAHTGRNESACGNPLLICLEVSYVHGDIGDSLNQNNYKDTYKNVQNNSTIKALPGTDGHEMGRKQREGAMSARAPSVPLVEVSQEHDPLSRRICRGVKDPQNRRSVLTFAWIVGRLLLAELTRRKRHLFIFISTLLC